ncbi:MAG: hypothetical protein IAF02_20920 [Anaerolineae bacterium]|nr:hypothetical protein [Anaerolineae bacterium]
MTYEKAVQALVTAGLLDPKKVKTAVAALKKPNVEFTYPDWAQALARAGLIPEAQVDSAANVMQAVGEKEAEDDPDDFEKGLEDAEIL